MCTSVPTFTLPLNRARPLSLGTPDCLPAPLGVSFRSPAGLMTVCGGGCPKGIRALQREMDPNSRATYTATHTHIRAHHMPFTPTLATPRTAVATRSGDSAVYNKISCLAHRGRLGQRSQLRVAALESNPKVRTPIFGDSLASTIYFGGPTAVWTSPPALRTWKVCRTLGYEVTATEKIVSARTRYGPRTTGFLRQPILHWPMNHTHNHL